MAVRAYNFGLFVQNGIGALYEVMGSFVGPGVVREVRLTLTSTANVTLTVGLAIGRSDDGSQAGYRASWPLMSCRTMPFDEERRTSLRIRTTTQAFVVPWLFAVYRPIVSGVHFLIMYFDNESQNYSVGIMASVIIDVRGGSGRRSGDVPVKVAPAGAGVLTSLQAEARRASGRNGK